MLSHVSQTSDYWVPIYDSLKKHLPVIVGNTRDMKAFLHSEVREKPELTGFPVVVGTDTNRGKGRSIVFHILEASYTLVAGFKAKFGI